MIIDSFKTCAITNNLDGSEDGLIEVLKDGKMLADKVDKIKRIGITLNENGGDYAALGLTQSDNQATEEIDADSGNELHIDESSGDEDNSEGATDNA